MTFIQPNKNSSILNTILAVIAIGLVAATFGMVALYNATVNLSHTIAEVKVELDAVGAKNIDLNNTVVATLSGSEIAAIVAKNGLVPESKPTYFHLSQTTDPKWPIASHY